MSLVVEQEKVIPSSGKYDASTFASTMTIITVILYATIIGIIIFGILSVLAGIVQFNNALKWGLLEVDENGKRLVSPETELERNALNYTTYLRLGFALAIFGLVLMIPAKWLARTYGRQTVEIDNEGIFIKKWPRIKHIVPWEGVLDITVKQSDSVFSNFARNIKKITIYTMDKSIHIEAITLANSKEITAKLQAFGDSLEERVIDFGYGASIAVIWRRMKRNRIGLLGASLVIFFIFYALLGAVLNIIYPLNSLSAQLQKKILIFWNPNFTDFGNINKPPSLDHFFGTDANGRDIFSRLLFGAFYSILIAVISTVISTVIGAFVGAASGYLGGTVDQIIQRVTEILNAMPGLPILLLISTSITLILQNVQIEGAYYLAVYSIFALIGWGGIARIVRSEVLGLKNSEFIQAELILGSTHGRIIRKHIIPNAFSTIIIFFTLGVAGNIIGVASLSYLGFGSNSTLVWGKDLSDAIFNQPLKHWWGTTFISLMLFLLVLGFNLLGDTLRDALDPTLKH